MNDIVKNNLCITCAPLKNTDKNGYIACKYFTRTQARECGMTVFRHCFCADCVRKDKW